MMLHENNSFFKNLQESSDKQDKTNTVIPVVAIATALMPPLCICGYSIANGRGDMLLGAGYLFIINAYFIFMSAGIMLSVLKIPKMMNLTPKEWKTRPFRMIVNTIIIILPSISAVYFMMHYKPSDEIIMVCK